MCKKEFLDRLRSGLNSLPPEEIEERLSFYSDMIDDRIEEGYPEEDAVSAVGSVASVLGQILSEMPPKKPHKERRKLSPWEIVLLVLGSPLWLSLLITVFAVIFSVVVSLWSVVIALWAVFAAVAICSFGFLISGVGFIIAGYGLSGFITLFASLICTGVSILMFFGCKLTTVGMAWLTKKLFAGIRKIFVKMKKF